MKKKTWSTKKGGGKLGKNDGEKNQNENIKEKKT